MSIKMSDKHSKFVDWIDSIMCKSTYKKHMNRYSMLGYHQPNVYTTLILSFSFLQRNTHNRFNLFSIRSYTSKGINRRSALSLCLVNESELFLVLPLL